MPVFITAKNSGPVVPAFQERGIADLMPGLVGDVPINVSSTYNSITFNNAMRSFHSAYRAEFSKSPVFGDLEAYNIFKDYIPPFYFERPSASFLFSGLSEQDLEIVRGAGLHEEPGRPGVFIGSPGSESMSALYKLGPIDGRINPGTVSADGYLAYIIGLKAMAIFSYITQKAVGQPNITLMYNSHLVSKHPTPEDPIPKYNVWNVTECVELPPDACDRISKTDQPFISVLNNVSVVHTPFTRGGGMIPNIVTMDPATIPNGMNGHFFAYFPGMNVPDKDIMPEVFGSIFDRSLGMTATSSYNLLQRLRKGFRNLALFRGGQAMSHAFIGMRLAREASCPLHYVVANGVYYGFVLAGHVTVRLYRSETPAMDTAELRKDIGLLNKHGKCLRKILSILNSPENSDGQKVYNFEMADVRTSRGLARVLLSINHDLYVSTDWKKELKDEMEGLMYGDEFKKVTAESFLAFLTFLSDGNFEAIAGYPAYLTSLLVEAPDRVAYGLSMFGPRVPTMTIPGKGKDFTIPALGAVDANLVVPEGGSRPLKYIPLTEVPYGQGVGLWNQVFNNGRFTIANPRGKKAEFTDNRGVILQVAGDTFFPAAYEKIKAIVASRRAGAGVKRKKTGEEATGTKRQKKAAIEDADEV